MPDLSKFKDMLNGKPVAVYGLGLSGMATVKAFAENKIPCVAWDDVETKRDECKIKGVKVENILDHDVSDYACIVLGPGIPLYYPEPHRVVKAARDADVEIIGDLEVLHRSGHGRKVIAITGTNGKSTTTALVGHILKENKIPYVIAGNIGHPALSVTLPKKDGYIVLEVSSFQLDLCKDFKPDISALINMSPDHIDRHGDMDGYINAKKNVFNPVGKSVIGIDDKYTKQIVADLKSENHENIVEVTAVDGTDAAIRVEDGMLWDGEKEVGKVSNIKMLPGKHNLQNIAITYGILKDAGMSHEQFLEALKTYPGLPHRMYLTRMINGVAYVNDSKATNAVSAATALACYKKIYWIVGGRAKDGGLVGVEGELEGVKHAFVIGEAADEFEGWLNRIGIETTSSKTMEQAVMDAHKMAQDERGEPGGAATVLLSPACASFDQYKSFEARGEHFEQLVAKLPEDNPA